MRINIKNGVDIEIEPVYTYAHGLDDHGTVVIWAAGKAGWYEINASKEYENIYNDMVTAVELVWFLEDVYSKKRKRSRISQVGSLSVQQIYAKVSCSALDVLHSSSWINQYAQEHPETCASLSETEKLFRKHRHFIIARMVKEGAKIRWNETMLYLHYRDRFRV